MNYPDYDDIDQEDIREFASFVVPEWLRRAVCIAVAVTLTVLIFIYFNCL